ncbi:MAG: hypothetical protein V3V61_00870 [Gammaproteobacteria bacterium]
MTTENVNFDCASVKEQIQLITNLKDDNDFAAQISQFKSNLDKGWVSELKKSWDGTPLYVLIEQISGLVNDRTRRRSPCFFTSPFDKARKIMGQLCLATNDC